MKLAQLRKFCLDLPGTAEDIKWEHNLCFIVGEKMFCVTSFEPEAAVSLKVLPEEFDELCEKDGIIPAPYLAKNKWICVEDKSAFTLAEWKYHVKKSYDLISAGLTKKKRMELGIE